jgi:hypothetical protein
MDSNMLMMMDPLPFYTGQRLNWRMINDFTTGEKRALNLGLTHHHLT